MQSTLCPPTLAEPPLGSTLSSHVEWAYWGPGRAQLAEPCMVEPRRGADDPGDSGQPQGVSWGCRWRGDGAREALNRVRASVRAQPRAGGRRRPKPLRPLEAAPATARLPPPRCPAAPPKLGRGGSAVATEKGRPVSVPPPPWACELGHPRPWRPRRPRQYLTTWSGRPCVREAPIPGLTFPVQTPRIDAWDWKEKPRIPVSQQGGEPLIRSGAPSLALSLHSATSSCPPIPTLWDPTGSPHPQWGALQ